MKYAITVLPLLLFLSACSDSSHSSITATGTLEATEVTVSAQVNGLIEHVPVQEGDLVWPGDTLAVIDRSEWTQQLRQAEANLAAMEAQYMLAMEGPRREDVAQAEAHYESARNDLKRMEELFDSKAVTAKQLEDARTRYILAEQSLRKLREGTRPEERALARARRDQAEAAAAVLRKKLADCTITAPRAGTITNRFVEPGELVGPGAAIVRIADLTDLTINVYVPEADLPRILLGQKAEVRVDAFKERVFEGRVVHISQSAEFTPKNIQTKDERVKLVFAVKVRVPNPDGTLKAGLPADVALPTDNTR
ncbi:MAG: hemolysin secretion protein D [Bacteroidia bacterium]|nr:MAG: hemolysin secretion protein D [Bacteroidia bacterium]